MKGFNLFVKVMPCMCSDSEVQWTPGATEATSKLPPSKVVLAEPVALNVSNSDATAMALCDPAPHDSRCVRSTGCDELGLQMIAPHRPMVADSPFPRQQAAIELYVLVRDDRHEIMFLRGNANVHSLRLDVDSPPRAVKDVVRATAEERGAEINMPRRVRWSPCRECA